MAVPGAGSTILNDDDLALCHSSVGARAPFDEGHDRAMSFVRRREISAVDPQLGPSKAHHHIAIAREPATLDAFESKAAQAGEQLIGVLERRRR